MCIVTGSRIDLAIALIDRMKKLFIGKNKGPVNFDTKRDSNSAKQCKDRSFPFTSFRYNAWFT
jgi:hypothetical protein